MHNNKSMNFTRMKSKSAIAVLSSVFWASLASTAAAQDAPSARRDYEIKSIVLGGQVNLLTPETRLQALAQMQSDQPRRLTGADLQSLVAKLQAWLDAKLPKRYAARIPSQALEDGRLFVVIEPKVVAVAYETAPGIHEEQLRASLPSLTVGKALPAGQDWVDARELQMANDNPLKSTVIDYLVEPDAGVRVLAKAKVSSLGLQSGTVTMTNWGNDVTGRGQVAAQWTDANVSGRDDVLTLQAISSVKPAWDNRAATATYEAFDFAEHRSHKFTLKHASGRTSFSSLNYGDIHSSGQYDEVNYKMTHYLGDYPALGGLKAFKLGLDVSWLGNKGRTEFQTLGFTDFKSQALPLRLNLEGLWEVSDKTRVQGRMALFAADARWLGSSQAAQWQAARADADTRFAALQWLVQGETTLPADAKFNWQFSGLYSGQKLLPVFQSSVTDPGSAVRGFVNAYPTGDQTAVLRTELQSARWSPDMPIRVYGFYDMGHKRGGSDGKTLTVASTGLGLRMQEPTASWRFDAFAAYKVRGQDLDMKADGLSTKDRTSYWLTSSYSF